MAMQPDSDIGREDVLMLLAAAPERVADILAAIDSARMAYRHGPAFPTLGEVLAHLSETASRFDAAMRHAFLDHAEEVDVRGSIDQPYVDHEVEEPEELMQGYARIRRRTVDLLRGMSDEDLERMVVDPVMGPVSLLDSCRAVVRHELGHLTQIRNLVSLLPESVDLGPIASTANLGTEADQLT